MSLRVCMSVFISSVCQGMIEKYASYFIVKETSFSIFKQINAYYFRENGVETQKQLNTIFGANFETCLR